MLIDHNNDNSPIYEINDYFYQTIPIYFNNYYDIILNWEIIKYKKQKGIFRIFNKLLNKKDEYSYGYIKDYKREVKHEVKLFSNNTKNVLELSK